MSHKKELDKIYKKLDLISKKGRDGIFDYHEFVDDLVNSGRRYLLEDVMISKYNIDINKFISIDVMKQYTFNDIRFITKSTFQEQFKKLMINNNLYQVGHHIYDTNTNYLYGDIKEEEIPIVNFPAYRDTKLYEKLDKDNVTRLVVTKDFDLLQIVYKDSVDTYNGVTYSTVKYDDTIKMIDKYNISLTELISRSSDYDNIYINEFNLYFADINICRLIHFILQFEQSSYNKNDSPKNKITKGNFICDDPVRYFTVTDKFIRVIDNDSVTFQLDVYNKDGDFIFYQRKISFSNDYITGTYNTVNKKIEIKFPISTNSLNPIIQLFYKYYFNPTYVLYGINGQNNNHLLDDLSFFGNWSLVYNHQDSTNLYIDLMSPNGMIIKEYTLPWGNAMFLNLGDVISNVGIKIGPSLTITLPINLDWSQVSF